MFTSILGKPLFYFDTDEGGGGTNSASGSDNLHSATSPATPASSVPGQGENWEDRFKGQQRFAQGLQTQLNTATLKHQEAVTSYEGKITTLSSERDTAMTAQKSAESAKAQLMQENLGLKKQLEVVNQIIGNPELAVLLPFQAKGLLSVGNLEGEELTQYLKDYASTLAGVRTEAVRDTLAGAAPPAATGAKTTAGLTEDQMYQALMDMSPSDERYPALLKQFNELSSNKK